MKDSLTIVEIYYESLIDVEICLLMFSRTNSGNGLFRSGMMFPKESHLSSGMHLRFLAQMDPHKGRESSLKSAQTGVSNMYIRFDFFSGFLSPRL